MYNNNTFYLREQVEWLKCFRKPCFLSLCSIFSPSLRLTFKMDERASKQDFR